VRYGVLAFGAVLLAIIVARATVIGGRGEPVAFTALRDTSSGLLVLAGTVLLVTWALTGKAARALDGAALLFVGGGLLVLAGPWGELLHSNQNAMMISPACRLAVSLPALVPLTRSAGAVPVDSSIRPMSTLVRAAVATIVLLGAETILRLWGPIDNSVLLATALFVLAAAWALAGGRRVLSTSTELSPTGEGAIGWALVIYAAGDALLAVTFLTSPRWGVIGVALQGFAAVLIAWVSVSWMLEVLSRNGSRRLRLVGELTEVNNVLADEKSTRNQLLHDARNVVAAIDTANITLERHGQRLEPEVKEWLRVAVGSEFARLQVLLDPSQESSTPS
jgi:hypothetical protein